MVVGRYPCGVCGRPVKATDAGIYCEVGLHWVHCRCASISDSEYRVLQRAEGGWCCPNCEHSALPFADCSITSSASPRASSPSLSPRSNATDAVPAPTPPLLHPSSSPRASIINPKPARSFSIYYSNCRSLLPKLDELRHLCSGPDHPCIIALCETWLDSTIMDCELTLPNYCLFRRDRSRHGGGVAMYIHHSVLVRKVTHCDSYELLSAEIQDKSGLILLSVVYRPPGSDSDLLGLTDALGSLNLPRYSKAIVVGDFNVDMSAVHTSL